MAWAGGRLVGVVVDALRWFVVPACAGMTEREGTVWRGLRDGWRVLLVTGLGGSWFLPAQE